MPATKRPTHEQLREQLAGGKRPVQDLSGVVVGRYRQRAWLNLTALSLAAKAHNAPLLEKVAWNMTWQCIKRSNPPLAALVSSPEVQAALARFKGSRVAIDCTDLHKGKASA